MGGLLPWSSFKIEEDIDAFVSLGTPWNGSAFAALAPWSTSARQMKIGAKYLENTRINANLWDKPKLSVCGAWDLVVPKNSHLKNATQVDIPHCSHAGLLYSKRAYYEIWAWLTYEVFKEVGHEDGRGF